MQKIIGVTDLQRRFRAVFDEVAKDHDTYVLTRSSRPEAVLIPYDEYVRYQQTQESDVLRRVDEMIVSLAERNAGYRTGNVATDVAEVLADVRLASMGMSQSKIEAFCRQHHIRKLSLFGSVTHADFNAESDIDVLVEFDPAHIPGFEFFSIQTELSRLLGREVNLKTPGFLSDHFRDEVLEQATVCYVAE